MSRAGREAALAGYRDSGLGKLEALVARERVEALLEEAGRLWREFSPQGPANLRIGLRVDPAAGQVRLDRLDPVADVSASFAGLNRDPDLVSLAEEGLGGPVIVMKEKLIYRWPETPGFGLHRDGDYNTPKTGVPGADVMTICIALDRANRENGAVEFFPELRFVATPKRADEPRDVDEAAVEGIANSIPELDPGDALLFDALVPHRSARNSGDRPRRLYMVSYVPSRYADARDRYYAARMVEQAAERRGFV